jgi:hypothetical protein
MLFISLAVLTLLLSTALFTRDANEVRQVAGLQKICFRAHTFRHGAHTLSVCTCKYTCLSWWSPPSRVHIHMPQLVVIPLTRLVDLVQRFQTKVIPCALGNMLFCRLWRCQPCVCVSVTTVVSFVACLACFIHGCSYVFMSYGFILAFILSVPHRVFFPPGGSLT